MNIKFYSAEEAADFIASKTDLTTSQALDRIYSSSVKTFSLETLAHCIIAGRLSNLIRSAAKANPAGFTLDLRTRKLIDHTHGYVVAIAATQDSHDASNIPDVLRVARQHNLSLVGGWWDEKEEKYYFDACAWCSSIHEAVKLGLAQGQKAIYDIANDTVIRLEK